MTECVSRAVAARALTHGMLKLMAKINARPSALVKFEARISEMPTAAAPEALAPKVELTRLPPVPYRVFSTPKRFAQEAESLRNGARL